MAADEALLEEAERGGFSARVYGWDALWVTLGRFQDAERDLVAPDAQPWIVRPTGGKAVLHGHDATVSLAAPLERLGADARSIRAVYRTLAAPLVAALREAGLPALLADGTPHAGRGSRTADCFAFNSPNDIVHEATGKKVCGCALRLTSSAVLLQASIPARPPRVPPESVIRGATPIEIYPWQPDRLPHALESALAIFGAG